MAILQLLSEGQVSRTIRVIIRWTNNTPPPFLGPLAPNFFALLFFVIFIKNYWGQKLSSGTSYRPLAFLCLVICDTAIENSNKVFIIMYYYRLPRQWFLA